MLAEVHDREPHAERVGDRAEPDAPAESEAEEHHEQRVGGMQRRHGGRLVADVVELVDPRGGGLGHARHLAVADAVHLRDPAVAARHPGRGRRPDRERDGAREADDHHRRGEAVVQLAPP